MNIAVFVKASLDPNMIRTDSSGRILIEEIPLAISEYDRNAIEEAVKVKSSLGGRVVAISALTWGPIQKRVREGEQVLREALAMGADEAYLIVDESLIPASPLTTVKALSSLVKSLGGFDLYLTGEASMDSLSFQMTPRIGEALGVASVTHARRLEIEGSKARITRDLEEHLETVEVELPVVVSVTGEINQPRLPTLLQIRRAFTKPLKKLSLSDIKCEVPREKFRREDIKLLKVARKNVIIEGESLEEIASKLVESLVRDGVLK